MKWYDYILCVWFAYLIASGFFLMDITVMAIGAFLYMIYEDLRRLPK